MKANIGSGMKPNSLAIAEPDVIPCRVTKRDRVDYGLCPLRAEGDRAFRINRLTLGNTFKLAFSLIRVPFPAP